ncbi:WhiB family transcription factor [Gordonia phage Mollymur]|uniref:WhiB family transcription factor n=1 Tax=Gordonia phage Mollymur TaxID=2590895 RepID=A0A4Y6EAJ1_9CAUD|nr:transcriptional regulator WhiB-like [Gordonia phage Mollymur]QDF15437.1 WhiB family transcription factor [Gordonia phage Mollymur]
MPKPLSRDWMLNAYCRTAEDRNGWFTDSRRGPMQNYARRKCSPCEMHQQCAAYTLSLPELPIGVVVAGVAMGEDTSELAYQSALDRVRLIAEGGVDADPTQNIDRASDAAASRRPSGRHLPPTAVATEGEDVKSVQHMTAGQLTAGVVGRMLQVGSRGGVIHEVRPRIRPGGGHFKAVDIHVRINTEHGMKSLVLSPKTPVVIR